jgi:hypothetical protein
MALTRMARKYALQPSWQSLRRRVPAVLWHWQRRLAGCLLRLVER